MIQARVADQATDASKTEEKVENPLTEEERRQKRYEACQKKCILDWEEDIAQKDYTPVDFEFE